MARINELVSGWMSHRKVLHELLDTFEDQHLSYKPWEEAMSLSRLVLHISGAMEMFADTVINGEFTPPTGTSKIETISELKTFVENQTNQTKSKLESLTEDQLAAIVEFAGMKMPGLVLLESGKDHEIHHKGQLFTYARLLGVESLPFFVSRS
ncbi:DinB family protein [Metabacillus niabensis]|uniref:DinB family protein n=1 Tax=Metabacillus niabensis TaxID=324854 RepID=UPI001CFAEA13|nr:DinB family protein [Metabacillus niabensis]